MGKLAGLLMIAAGLGTAAYVYPQIASPDVSEKQVAEKQLAEVVTIATPGATPAPRPHNATPAVPPTRVIIAQATSGQPALTVPVAAAVRVPTPTIIASAPAVPAPAAPAAAPPSATPATVRALVASQPSLAIRPIEPPVPQPARRTKADDDRAQLARDIQRELKRVGCLQSDADGTWNASTRAAMRTFIERVNATLPTDEPDHILKTLVQGHPGNACSRGTSPSSIIAQAPAPTAKKVEIKPAATAKLSDYSTNVKPAEAKTAARFEPKPADPPAVMPSSSSWQAAVTPSAPLVTGSTATPPAMAAITALAGANAIAGADARPATTLPGRMAVGAAAVATPTEPQPPVTTFKAEADGAKSKLVVKPKSHSDDDNRDEAKRDESRKDDRPPVSEPTRRASPPPAPKVAAYRPNIPPPRYVGAYSGGGGSASSRPRFGPQIFRQLEASGR